MINGVTVPGRHQAFITKSVATTFGNCSNKKKSQFRLSVLRLFQFYKPTQKRYLVPSTIYTQNCSTDGNFIQQKKQSFLSNGKFFLSRRQFPGSNNQDVETIPAKNPPSNSKNTLFVKTGVRKKCIKNSRIEPSLPSRIKLRVSGVESDHIFSVTRLPKLTEFARE